MKLGIGTANIKKWKKWNWGSQQWKQEYFLPSYWRNTCYWRCLRHWNRVLSSFTSRLFWRRTSNTKIIDPKTWSKHWRNPLHDGNPSQHGRTTEKPHQHDTTTTKPTESACCELSNKVAVGFDMIIIIFNLFFITLSPKNLILIFSLQLNILFFSLKPCQLSPNLMEHGAT